MNHTIEINELAQISIPVSLISGRHDRANRLKIAETASKRFGWPLHVIENSRNDPKLEQPGAFLKALYTVLDSNGPDTKIRVENYEKHKTVNQKI